ncbi:MAG TPA: diguanylate cyclase [Candidatus Polarisedimenticolaceae bacterium]|nr:diguanylate cyclase [Candidatus Polarisedimenticolaceae bacterium]
MKILLAEDEPLSLRLLQHSVSVWGYEVVTAADGSEAWRILERDDGPCLAIVDWMMPGSDGLDLCRKARAQRREPYVYIVVLTERHHPADAVLALKAGADDFLSKPVDEEELRARLRVGERIIGLQRELISSRDALMTLATHDLLTGLHNRHAILHSLAREMNRASRERSPLAVAVADVDHFKSINDTYGHAAGDAVLQEVARRMQTPLRSYNLVGRYGGEEFLVVLPGCDGAIGCMVADKVRAAVAAEPIRLGSESVTVTCSLGVAAFSGDRRIEPLTLIHSADEALYRAKRNGRNRVESAETPAVVPVRLS